MISQSFRPYGVALHLRKLFKMQADTYSGEISTLPTKSNARLGQFIIILIVALAFLAISSTSLIRGQEDIQSSVFQAYVGLANVYGRGGQSPDLVARLNAAIGLAEQAKVKRENGDMIGAASLENQAETEIIGVMSEIPAAQQNATQVSSTRTLAVAALVPVSVIVSTFVSYAVLRTWRAYEKRQLYEMRIIEKE